MSKTLVILALTFLAAGSAQANGICITQVFNMINPVNKELRTVGNSCQAESLAEEGFVEVGDDEDNGIDMSMRPTVITNATASIQVLKAQCSFNTKKCPSSSKLIVSLPLNGCSDSSLVTYKINVDASGNRQVVISALNIPSELSKSVKCIQQAVDKKIISLGSGTATTTNTKIEFLTSEAK